MPTWPWTCWLSSAVNTFHSVSCAVLVGNWCGAAIPLSLLDCVDGDWSSPSILLDISYPVALHQSYSFCLPSKWILILAVMILFLNLFSSQPRCFA